MKKIILALLIGATQAAMVCLNSQENVDSYCSQFDESAVNCNLEETCRVKWISETELVAADTTTGKSDTHTATSAAHANDKTTLKTDANAKAKKLVVKQKPKPKVLPVCVTTTKTTGKEDKKVIAATEICTTAGNVTMNCTTTTTYKKVKKALVPTSKKACYSEFTLTEHEQKLLLRRDSAKEVKPWIMWGIVIFCSTVCCCFCTNFIFQNCIKKKTRWAKNKQNPNKSMFEGGAEEDNY